MEERIKFKKVYTKEQESVIGKEFKRLEGNRYLDHAGATLYSEKQIKHVFSDFTANTFANPHANNIVSKATDDAIDIIRYQILEHFNTTPEEYSVIFTSGATQSLKIIGEYFDYGNKENAYFTYLEDNHTSALGMRNYAENSMEVKVENAFSILSKTISSTENKEDRVKDCNCLFVYPAQSNFSGTKYPLSWISSIKNGALNKLFKVKCKHWYVVLDAASYVSTNSLDLDECKPDFVTISFYKMFGYPTGLGALLVKRGCEKVLNKKYFGGGTVLMALSSENTMVPRSILHERFEDGTLPFLSIIALQHGFSTLKRLNLNLDLISMHTFSLAQYVYKNLSILHHSNGRPVAILYHDTTFENMEHQGGIVNFNLLRPNGEYIGYSEVLHLANLHGIVLRTGCFCNPGSCQRFLKLTASDVKKHFNAGHICGDQHDLVDGYPTGSVRISFGYMSATKDADSVLEMIENCFVSKPTVRKKRSAWQAIENNYNNFFRNITEEKENEEKSFPATITANNKDLSCDERKVRSAENGVSNGSLERIFLYPVKSCGSFSVKESWELTSTGLKYDRLWMIVNSNGVCVTQKQNRRLCLVQPHVDLKREALRLSFKGFKDNYIEIPLNKAPSTENTAYLCQSKVCGDKIQGWDCGDQVAEWLSNNLETSGLRLLRQCDLTEELIGRSSRKEKPSLSLANKAQYLLVNSASVEWLKSQIPEDHIDEPLDLIAQRFRPNFVVNFGEAFMENSLEEFLIDDIKFKFAGKCTRCQMICIDQNTGEISKEPLLSLSRAFNGKICFGIYLNQETNINQEFIRLKSSVIGKILI